GQEFEGSEAEGGDEREDTAFEAAPRTEHAEGQAPQEQRQLEAEPAPTVPAQHEMSLPAVEHHHQPQAAEPVQGQPAPVEQAAAPESAPEPVREPVREAPAHVEVRHEEPAPVQHQHPAEPMAGQHPATTPHAEPSRPEPLTAAPEHPAAPAHGEQAKADSETH
ncbi:MAG TPA: hypothetical protein VNX47_14210, partial [Nevskia sp.]|nr:hypothetical protein [Nevskia sp.]